MLQPLGATDVSHHDPAPPPTQASVNHRSTYSASHIFTPFCLNHRLCCSLLFIVGCRWIQADSTFYNPFGTELSDAPPAYMQSLLLLHWTIYLVNLLLFFIKMNTSASTSGSTKIILGCIGELNLAHSKHGSSVDVSSSSGPNLYFHT